jgi:glycine dehydrogenase
MKINFESTDKFQHRHIGPNSKEIKAMLDVIGCKDLDELISLVIPDNINLEGNLDLPEAVSEYELLKELKEIASENKVFKSYIGLGYHNTIVPPVILRNIFNNPGWYTQYTPYQAEISQGRLEALLNFQTMVADLTGMEIANASLLDEGTAAAEAMIMIYNERNKRNKGDKCRRFLVSENCLPQTIDILKTRATPLDIEVVISKSPEFDFSEDIFGVLIQYPNKDGRIKNYRTLISSAHEHGIEVVMAADILSLTIIEAPGKLGADVVVGSTQRFGVPLGYGGPHAAYFATKDKYKRMIPGRIIGVSEDQQGGKGLRMALQTREQHIKREKATSNICTAQALLAIMAGMYAVYHGPKGLRAIAFRVHSLAKGIEAELNEMGYNQLNDYFFDTIKISTDGVSQDKIREIAEDAEYNFRYEDDDTIVISIDETTSLDDANAILWIFAAAKEIPYPERKYHEFLAELNFDLPDEIIRTKSFLEHDVFNKYHSETDMMRYIKSLENKDLSLTSSMIPLGSCTMKLNGAAQLLPLNYDGFANMHPFVPNEQALGYQKIITDLENYLSEITGFSATSLQPNSGAQGEYAGLMVIKAYHEDHGDANRNIVLIPASAHGTNPASAVMAGMKVVVIPCDKHGNIKIEELKLKAQEYKETLAALMVTYPSTHGVYEKPIIECCNIIHDNGGLVYMDGANMNAQVGLTNPAIIGADVCHLNLHKTFAIPHGGGGPGMGPICVNDKLKPYLPSNPIVNTGGVKAISSISAAPWGSASILIISYAYIRLLGREGLKNATVAAILNANYLKAKLEKTFDVLYTNLSGKIAHEFILDFRMYKHNIGIDVEDISKRLMDFSFHAPTVSFPVPGTLMVEPTESESKSELDRFVNALLEIKREIDEVSDGTYTIKDNVLKNAPHTLKVLLSNNWDHDYSREKAAFPLESLKESKFWPSIGRINNSLGDRNLICTCPSIEEYA